MSPSLSYPKPTCKLLINGVHHINLIASKALKMEVSEKKGEVRWYPDGMEWFHLRAFMAQVFSLNLSLMIAHVFR